jgi:adiponectin receptor
MHPIANKPHFRPYRAGMFVALGLSAALPFIYLQNAPDSYAPYVLPSWDVMPWLYGGVAYIAGAVIFALRIPERWYPYKFDLMGSSHNIHHICVVIGLTIHFNDAMRLYIDFWIPGLPVRDSNPQALSIEKISFVQLKFLKTSVNEMK